MNDKIITIFNQILIFSDGLSDRRKAYVDYLGSSHFICSEHHSKCGLPVKI